MLKFEDLVEGNIYFINNNNDKGYIYRYKENNRNVDSNDAFLCLTNNYFNSNLNGIYIDYKELRNATKEESLWLNECIFHQRFIPLSQIKLNKEIEYEIY